MEVSVLQKVLLQDFDQETTKLGQNLCPLYRECRFMVPFLHSTERFHCTVISTHRRGSDTLYLEEYGKQEGE